MGTQTWELDRLLPSKLASARVKHLIRQVVTSEVPHLLDNTDSAFVRAEARKFAVAAIDRIWFSRHEQDRHWHRYTQEYAASALAFFLEGDTHRATEAALFVAAAKAIHEAKKIHPDPYPHAYNPIACQAGTKARNAVIASITATN